MTFPRNSDEEADWDDDDYVDLSQVLERLSLAEDLLDQPTQTEE